MFRILLMRTQCEAVTTRMLCRKVKYFKDSQGVNQFDIKKFSEIDACQKVEFAKDNPLTKQMDYIKSLDGLADWTTVKKKILSFQGNINQKNIDAVVLKMLVTKNNFTAAISFVQYLKSSNEELTLGSINAILNMYTKLGMLNQLSGEQKQYILDTYEHLYEKYKVLDYSTCENLLHSLCTINDWEKALKVLDNIHLSSIPTNAAYSTIVATLFKNNKKKIAFELIDQSILHKRLLQDNAYDEWIQYILRKYKDKKVLSKHLDKIFEYIATNWITVTEMTADRLKELYISLNWDGQVARIRKTDGQCSNCKNVLGSLILSDEEFNTLQNNVKEKLIVGSDLLIKTTHQELNSFLDFIERSPPCDVVLDGLNICYAFGKSTHTNKLHFLDHIVEHFVKENKKVMLLSRQHMLTWNKRLLQKIMYKTSSFFTDNLSEDDPFFITAAILKGPNTDIVTKDLLRTHKFNLKDENLKQLFIRWQLQHQWMAHLGFTNKPVLLPPLKYTPCAQKENKTWHIPFGSEIKKSFAMTDSRTLLNTSTWLCLRQKEIGE